MNSYKYMRHNPEYEYHQNYQENSFLWPKVSNLGLSIALLLLALIYSGLYALDFKLLSLQELLWNCLVYATPSRLLYLVDDDLKHRAMADPDLRDIPQTHAAKSTAIRRLIGLDKPGGIIGTVTQAGRRRLSIIPGIKISLQGEDDRPPGLGNWDNSCYQNSVLQGLSSLDSFPEYLVDPRRPEGEGKEDAKDSSDMKMSDSLRDLIATLKSPSNNGKRIWTPATLKSMSSWQQQDAQEYFSKVLDEIDKEITNASRLAAVPQSLVPDDYEVSMTRVVGIRELDRRLKETIRNPLEGLLAQRVGCTRCGYSEGLSMIPFNCVTVPLGRAWSYEISQCLDEYTKLETIDGVECGKCTLLKSQRLLLLLIDRTKDATDGDQVRQSAIARLRAVTEALEDDDYEDKTLTQKCNLPPKNRMATIKSRQAVIARPPQSLAVHINRSVFDELTGELKKNYAAVEFPKILDLGPWCLGSSGTARENHFEEWILDPAESINAGSKTHSRIKGPIYELRAVVTHYGRHENGHYICYRKHLLANDRDEMKEKQAQWWRLSDDDVIKVTEENVLGQGGVFMLFYDMIEPAAYIKIDGHITEFTTPDFLPYEDIITAVNTPLPVSSDDELDSSEEDDASTRMSREQSIATTISEFGAEDHGIDPNYQPAKAMFISPYMQGDGVDQEGESQEDSMQSQPTGSMVMV